MHGACESNKQINLSTGCTDFCFFTSVIQASDKTLGADRTFKIAELCQKCVSNKTWKLWKLNGNIETFD